MQEDNTAFSRMCVGTLALSLANAFKPTQLWFIN